MRKLLVSIQYLFWEVTVYNLLFTFISAGLLVSYEEKSYPGIFWIKLAGHVFILAIYYMQRRKYLYFFHNLNQSNGMLVMTSFFIDALITLVILTIFKFIMT